MNETITEAGSIARLRWQDTRRAVDQREAFAALDALCGQIARHYVEQMTIRELSQSDMRHETW